ncbi:MAG: tryptophan synthase subunit alpha [Chloroflexota bacterium]|nr:tryptophan synthase subunit alpha [Chloroflexota bacterium]
MKNRIDSKILSTKSDNRPALVPYLTVGYPRIEESADIALKVLESGADMLELGVPFSDPIADGPTIQKTSFKALENGVSLSVCMDVLTTIRKSDDSSPIIFMGYFNPFLQYGLESFLSDASERGLDGLINTDLPIEESEAKYRRCMENGIHHIPLLAPTSTEARIKLSCEHAGGFIYCVSLTGVTGARDGLSTGVEGLVSKIRAHTNLPVLVGFGVSQKRDVEKISKFAEGAVVGSAFLDHISGAKQGDVIESASEFIKNIIIR